MSISGDGMTRLLCPGQWYDKVNSLWGTEGEAKDPDVETVLDAMLLNMCAKMDSVADFYRAKEGK